MAYLEDLQTEIQTDPLARGYSGMTNTEVADSLNLTVDRIINKATVTGAEAYDQTDATEYAALTDVEKNQWLALCGISAVDPFGPAAQAVIDLFGSPGSSNTTDALLAYRTKTVSRATELGFPNVTEGDVEKALLWPNLS